MTKEVLKLGDYVADIEDVNLTDIGVIAFDHMEHNGYDLYTVRWLNDKHLSTRDSTQIKKLDPEVAIKAWCSECIAYK